ncbi:hypothetical protein [Aliivibrio salmonicida]|uniref:hypothetical protein n=1 Tax=Aliivibrio salmonicida TaxID=40269 RepID=UPI003D0EEE4F
MTEDEKKVLVAIRAGTPYINPIKNTAPTAPIKASDNSAKAQAMIQIIIDSVPEPPPVIPAQPEPPEKIIPPLEQSWIDKLSLVSPHTSMVSNAAPTLNNYMEGVVSKYQETIGLHDSGMSVINEMDGPEIGTEKFNTAYALANGEAIELIDDLLVETGSILPLIPTALDPLLIDGQLIALVTHIDSLSSFGVLFDSKIATENQLKNELEKAARDYVLAMQSITWSSSSHTASLIESTGSDDLKAAL